MSPIVKLRILLSSFSVFAKKNPANVMISHHAEYVQKRASGFEMGGIVYQFLITPNEEYIFDVYTNLYRAHQTDKLLSHTTSFPHQKPL